MRVVEVADIPHLPFVVFWLVAAGLAAAWNSAVARHLVGVAALGWLTTIFIGAIDRSAISPVASVTGSTALLLGGGLVLASVSTGSLRALGLTLSTYASFALAVLLGPIGVEDYLFRPRVSPHWAVICGLAGIVLAFAAAAVDRRVGPAFVGIALVLAVMVATGWAGTANLPQPWTTYALALASMLSLVVSGMLDDVRPRVVAGWLGLGLMIASITWAVRGSLLRRAMFLATAGVVAVVLAALLGRLVPKERGRQ
jgi:hypothetical protein